MVVTTVIDRVPCPFAIDPSETVHVKPALPMICGPDISTAKTIGSPGFVIVVGPETTIVGQLLDVLCP